MDYGMTLVTDFKNRIMRSFSRASSTYHDTAKLQADIADALMKIAPDLCDNPKIIDIGCGTGFLAHLMQETYQGAHMTCCDISNDMLIEAQKNIKGDHVSFLQCDAERHEFSDKYDLIASNMSFQWFANLEETLKHYQTFLNRNGRILFSTLVGKTYYEWYDSLAEVGAIFGSPIQEQDVPQDLPYKIIQRTLRTEQYESPMAFLKMLKRIGAQGNMHPRQISKAQLEQACQIFERKYKNIVTYDIALVLL